MAASLAGCRLSIDQGPAPTQPWSIDKMPLVQRDLSAH